MIKVCRFSGKIPAIAYTDFSKVYISNDVSLSEYNVLYKHEVSHIYLSHLSRRGKISNIDKEIWNIAIDAEIALHIYDEKDEGIILAPRSSITGGITKQSKLFSKIPPDIIYAEEIYYWLLDNKEIIENCQSFDGKVNDSIEELIDDILERENIDVSELIDDCKKFFKFNKVQKDQESFMFDILKARRTSLFSIIDRFIQSNYSLDIVKSYSRPSRRQYDNVLKKGRKIKKSVPKIHVYVDRSGSFCPNKTFIANKKISSILLRYRTNIKTDFYYFNDIVLEKDPGFGDGGTNYKNVIEHIIFNSPEISIIITDDDPCPDIPELASQIRTNIIIYPIEVFITSLQNKIPCAVIKY